jgi:polyisoprenoid-binding protein YceI
MKRFGILAITLLFCLTAAGNLQAAVRDWEIDTVHSNVYFTIDHIYAKVRGQFDEFSGKVKFDPGNPAASNFSFEIATDSINTNVAKRDKHLRSADFFDTGKFPKITFTSVSVTDAGNNVYKVAGKLTVKGEVYDLTLPLTYAGIKEHPADKGKDVIGFNGMVTIDRLAYKIGTGKFYDMGIVGKDVEIFVTLELLNAR